MERLIDFFYFFSFFPSLLLWLLLDPQLPSTDGGTQVLKASEDRGSLPHAARLLVLAPVSLFCISLHPLFTADDSGRKRTLTACCDFTVSSRKAWLIASIWFLTHPIVSLVYGSGTYSTVAHRGGIRCFSPMMWARRNSLSKKRCLLSWEVNLFLWGHPCGGVFHWTAPRKKKKKKKRPLW